MLSHQEIGSGLRPRLLDGANFTPTHRTPWGGERIQTLKRLDVPGAPALVVGEAWELSLGPEFPSETDDGEALADVVAADEAAWLGAETGRGRSALLVKLLDAGEPLSVQIHPLDGDPELSADEAGKPESWVVVDHAPGAGLFLGFREDVDEAQVAETLEKDGDLKPLLYFVPVARGDCFVIEAGTPHCIGAGVTVVEPQHVAPGKKGVTYRYWDWNRRYDAWGRPDPTGRPRELHRDRALAVTEWDGPRGEALLDAIRVRAGDPDVDGRARLGPLIGPSGAALESNHLRVARLEGRGRVALPGWPVLMGLTVLAGEVEVAGVVAEVGRTMAIPADLGAAEVELDRGHAILSAVVAPKERANLHSAR